MTIREANVKAMALSFCLGVYAWAAAGLLTVLALLKYLFFDGILAVAWASAVAVGLSWVALKSMRGRAPKGGKAA